MTASRATFEVQVQKEGRWISDCNFEREEEARKSADMLFSDRTCEGVRIFRNWLRADGIFMESQIHCQTRLIKEDSSIRIGRIDTPPPFCQTEQDYFAFGSRQFMNRIFRAYLDKMFVTPLEILHDFKEFKRLQDTDTLLPSAVDRVATLQAADGTVDAKSRRDQIHTALSGISARARKVEKVKLPKIEDSFGGYLAALSQPEDEPLYLASVALSRDLLTRRSWLGKLDRLTALATQEQDERATDVLDDAIADVLTSNVVVDLLGSQTNLASAIIAMFDLADGRMALAKSDAGDSAQQLNAVLAGGRYPKTRLCILDRAHRQLKSTVPLSRSEALPETQAFARIIDRVLLPTGLISGPDTADALTQRYTRLVSQGGVGGRRAAIWGTLRAMPDMASGVLYLTELNRSDWAQEHGDDIRMKLNEALTKTALDDFSDKKLSPRERMARATHAYKVLSQSEFPDTVKDKVMLHIDSLIDNYLAAEKIIEKLDDASSHLRERAVRLVQFCAAGILPPKGKALTRTRTRILGLLRQPNFDEHFVAGIDDPVKAQKALRDFHQLLVKAGFG